MIGEINIIKMTVLPKILYYFQSIPLPLPNSIYETLNKLFSQLIWNNMKARHNNYYTYLTRMRDFNFLILDGTT